MSKWIMKQEMHLGFIRQTVGKGAIIEHDEEKNILIIDGNNYECIKDLTILKKYNMVDPYQDEIAKQIQIEAQQESKQRENRIKIHKGMEDKDEKLPIVKDDSEGRPYINIEHTKNKKNLLPKEIEKDIEIIKGDESPEDRKKEFENKLPILQDDSLEGIGPSLNKKPEIKKAEAMPIVHDDSLGSVNNSIPLNQTNNVKAMTAEEHNRIREENLKKAQKGFVDERIAKAIEAAESINRPDTGVIEVNKEFPKAKTNESMREDNKAEIKEQPRESIKEAPIKTPKKRGRKKGSKNNPKKNSKVDNIESK